MVQHIGNRNESISLLLLHQNTENATTGDHSRPDKLLITEKIGHLRQNLKYLLVIFLYIFLLSEKGTKEWGILKFFQFILGIVDRKIIQFPRQAFYIVIVSGISPFSLLQDEKKR